MKLLLCLVLCLAAGGPAFGASKNGMPLACSINALNAREQGRRETLVETLFPKAQVTENADGYTLTWSGDPSVYGKLAEFVGYERRCCPFLEFELRVSGPDAPVTLTLHGDDDIKAFIQETGLFQGKP
jgi:hypothetical protein